MTLSSLIGGPLTLLQQGQRQRDGIRQHAVCAGLVLLGEAVAFGA